MRLAIAIDWFDPAHGGAERSTHRIAQELQARGHEVIVLAGGGPEPSAGEVFEVRRWRKARRPRSGLDARRFARWVDAAIFGAEFDTSLSVASTLAARVVQPRAGLVVESMERRLASIGRPLERGIRRLGHGLSPRKAALLSLERRTFADPRVRLFIAISRFMERQMEERYGVPPERLALVPNGADLEAISPAERGRLREDVRRRYGWSDGTAVVLFPALDARRKGLEPLLHALVEVTRTRPAVTLAIAGENPRWARRLARRLGVADRVRPLGKVDDMRGVYVAADVTALPTWYDPASKVVIESLVAGTPVVTTASNGSADWIEALGEAAVGGAAGRVVPEAGDVAALAAAILALLAAAGGGGGLGGGLGLAPELAARMSMRRHVDSLAAILLRSR